MFRKIEFKIQYLRILLVIVLVFIITMFLNNLLFYISSPHRFLVASWESGDQLLFLSALLTTLITVFGLLWSFNDAKKSIITNHRLNVIPLFCLNSLDIRSYNDIFGFNSTSVSSEEDKILPKKSIYEEYKLNKVFIILSDNKITYKTDLKPEQWTLVKQRGFVIKKMNNTSNLSFEDFISVPFLLENFGNGPAIDFRFGINNKEFLKNERKYLSPKSLKKEENLYIHIFSNDVNIKHQVYELELIYSDIFGNLYNQIFEFELKFIDDKFQASLLPTAKRIPVSIDEKRSYNLEGIDEV